MSSQSTPEDFLREFAEEVIAQVEMAKAKPSDKDEEIFKKFFVGWTRLLKLREDAARLGQHKRTSGMFVYENAAITYKRLERETKYLTVPKQGKDT